MLDRTAKAATPPLVSVLCATYDYGRFLPGAIESVFSQSYPHIELVVVDDGSTDDTAAVMAGYGERIVAVTRPNGGQAAAFNTALEASTGSVICLLDADDLMDEHKVERVVAEFAADAEIGWIFHELQCIDLATMHPVDRVNIFPQPPAPAGRHDMRAVMRRGEPPITAPPASGLAFRREVLDRIFPLPAVHYLGDHYLKFAAMSAAPGLVLTETLALQGLHDANAYTNRLDIGSLQTRVFIATAIELERWDPTLARFAELLMINGLLRSRLGRTLPAEDRDLLRSWWRSLDGRRRRRVAVAVAARLRGRIRGRVRRALTA